MIQILFMQPVMTYQTGQIPRLIKEIAGNTSSSGFKYTVMIRSFRTNRPWQTVQIQIFTVCYSISIFLTKYSTVWPLCLNFRLITAKFSGVRKFRNFRVEPQILPVSGCQTMLSLPLPLYPTIDRNFSLAWLGGAV